MRLLIPVMIFLLVANSAGADVPPPPASKRLFLSHTIETTRSFPDYRIYLVKMSRSGVFGAATPPDRVLKSSSLVDIAPGRSLTISGLSENSAELIAVPVSAATDHIKLDDLWEAVRSGRVPGAVKSAVRFGFGDLPGLNGYDESRTVRWRLEKINAEEGIVLTEIPEVKESSPASVAPGSLLWRIAGVFVISAVALLLFRVARRSHPQRHPR